MNIIKKLIPVNFETRHNQKLGVCIHTMVGTLEGTDTWFRNPEAKASSHYGIGLDGTVYQWVEEDYIAWGQGRVSNPINGLYLDKKGNPNDYFISIECADNGKPQDADRSKQLPYLSMLVKQICFRNGIPLNRYFICGHKEIYSIKTCPGNIDVDKVVKLAQEADFIMDDDTKRALDLLQSTKASMGYGNLESTVRGLVGLAGDLVKVKNDLFEYQSGENERIKYALESAIKSRDDFWQSQLTSANKTITDLTEKVELLTITQAESMSYSVLFSIAWKKFWKVRKGGE